MTDPTPVPTPYGTLYVDPEELVIGRLLQADGELPDISKELAFFRKYLGLGDIAVDVGANYGLFTLALAQIVGDEGLVLAYEPNGLLAWSWHRTRAHNKLLHVSWAEQALGKEKGLGYIRFDPRGSGGTQVLPADLPNGFDVDVLTLDADVDAFRPIRAIKIDAEGADVDVLLGAEKILDEDRPAVIFEWNEDAMRSLGKDIDHELRSLFSLVNDLNYSITDLDSTGDFPERMEGNLAALPDELLYS